MPLRYPATTNSIVAARHKSLMFMRVPAATTTKSRHSSEPLKLEWVGGGSREPQPFDRGVTASMLTMVGNFWKKTLAAITTPYPVGIRAGYRSGEKCGSLEEIQVTMCQQIERFLEGFPGFSPVNTFGKLGADNRRHRRSKLPALQFDDRSDSPGGHLRFAIELGSWP